MATLVRFKWICQICGEPIDPALRPPHPMSATVHHVLGKRYGDDPKQLVAAHWQCNMKLGDPSRHDPRPKVRTRW